MVSHGLGNSEITRLLTMQSLSVFDICICSTSFSYTKRLALSLFKKYNCQQGEYMTQQSVNQIVNKTLKLNSRDQDNSKTVVNKYTVLW